MASKSVQKPDSDGWSKSEQFVLATLVELKASQLRTEERMLSVLVCLAGLKVRAGVWGLLGACIPVIVMLGINAYKQ